MVIDGEGQHGEFVQRLDGALGRRIEEPERLDVVTEELRSYRPLPERGEDVYDAAAQAPLPDLNDRVDALVAGEIEPLHEGFAVDGSRHLQGEGSRAEGGG